MKKTIVIGIGGTGLDALRCLRRRIVEDHESLAKFPQLGFLYIDTDPNAVVVTEDNRKRWEVLNTSVALTPSEFITIQAPSIGRIMADLDAYPQIKPWLPVEQLAGLDTAAKDTPGAQQIRALGRMIFTLNVENVRKKFAAVLNSLKEGKEGDTQIFVVCSLSGGTGSGMFLDLAYSLRQWTTGHSNSAAFLVMPDLNLEAVRGERYVINAYAALMDLNYFSLRANNYRGKSMPIGFQPPLASEAIRENPFDICYLVGCRNQAGVQLSLTALPDMIAHRIYLSFDSACADDVASVMNNGAMQRGLCLEDPFDGNRHAQYFSTFGLSSIQYPTEQITEILAYRLSDALVSGWLKTRTVDNVNQHVEAEFTNLRLIDDYLLGNKDFFDGGKDHASIEAEVHAEVSQIVMSTPEKNKAVFLRDRHAHFAELFRGGVLSYYRGLSDNMDGAVQVVMRLVRNWLSGAITNPELGFAYAMQALDELLRLLEIKKQGYDNEQKQLPNVAANSLRVMIANLGELTEAENALLFKQDKMRAATKKVNDSMVLNLQAEIGQNGYQFGVVLLTRLVNNLRELRDELSNWRTAMIKLREELLTEINRRSASLLAQRTNTQEFNGAILFQEDRIDQLYKGFDEQQALAHLQKRIMETGDLLALKQEVQKTLDGLYESAVEWLTHHSQVKVAEKNVASQLLEDYPGAKNDTRNDLIAANARKSKPFLEFDQGEKQIWSGRAGIGYTEDATTHVSLVAIMDDEQNRYPEVVQVRKDISAAAGMALGDIKKISDKHQILFISEATAFPLRLISDFRLLRDKYRRYVKQPKALPLHLQKAYAPPAGDLLLASQSEVQRHEEAEENFLTGWTEGWLRVELNQREQRNEVRYRYQSAGSDQVARLGDNWESAFEFWMSDGADMLRGRMAEDATRFFAKLDTQPKRIEFAGRLFGLLDAQRARFPLGEEDETYQMYHRIRNRLVTRRKLIREGETVTPTAPPPSPAAVTQTAPPQASPAPASTPAAASTQLSADEQRYLDAATDFLKRGKGNLTSEMAATLQTRQGRLRLSGETAEKLMRMAKESLGFGADAAAVAEYRQTLEVYLGAGELSNEDRDRLLALQAELHLTDEQADAIETAARLKQSSIGA